MTETRSVRTTTLLVRFPEEHKVLQQHYKVVRYLVPPKFSFIEDRYRFGKLHVRLKNQLSYPYVFFTHDELDGGHDNAVYVLYPKEDKIKPVTIDFLSKDELPNRQVAFTDLEAHVLVKLLFVDFFRQADTPHFMSQGDYYIYVKANTDRSGNVTSDLCLRIKLNGHRDNETKHPGDWLSFQITNHATRFKKVDEPKDWMKFALPLFKKNRPHDGLVFFSQLRPDDLPEDITDYAEDIYQISPYREHPAKLDYHLHFRPEHSRGKVLFDFINQIVPFLEDKGLEAKQRYRDVREYPPTKTTGQLDLALMPEVQVLDARVNRDHALPDYVDVLNQQYGDKVQFTEVNELNPEETIPTLVLLDGNADDFAEGGLLQDYDDPYQQLYSDDAYIHIPKQSVIVNQTDQEFETDTEYLQYEMITFDPEAKGPNYSQIFDVALMELLQKDIVINPHSVAGILPGFNGGGNGLEQYVFVRKKTYTNLGNFWVMMEVHDGELRFYNLNRSAERQRLYEIAEQYDLDWDEVFEALCVKRFREPDGDDTLPAYDVILGPGLAIEVEDINETVIYEYDEIIARQNEKQRALPIDAFRLATEDRYNLIRDRKMSPYDNLDLIELEPNPKPNQRASLEFFAQLEAFDELLDDLEMSRTAITYDELISGTNREEIGNIFGFTRNKPKKGQEGGDYVMTQLLNWYKTCGLFDSVKGKDIHLFQGIWYDDERCFVVGSAQALKDKQARAHRIRQFDVLSGEEHFDMESLLQTLGVQFVRHNQYTVVPYPYHLIDLYVENVLRWQE
jgi:hypothetical protein